MLSNRGLVSLALVAAAIPSYALTIDIVSIGSYGAIPPAYTTTETVIFQNTPAVLTTLAVAGTINNPGPNQFLVGTATYAGVGGTLVVSYTTSPVQASGGSASFDGTWTYVAGTGAYAGLMGTGAVNFLTSTSGFANHSLSGELEAVPEPASMAALGLGVVALLRRRKRSA